MPGAASTSIRGAGDFSGSLTPGYFLRLNAGGTAFELAAIDMSAYAPLAGATFTGAVAVSGAALKLTNAVASTDALTLYRTGSASTKALSLFLDASDLVYFNTNNADVFFQVSGVTRFKVPVTGGFGLWTSSIYSNGTLTLGNRGTTPNRQASLSFNAVGDASQQTYLAVTEAGYLVPGTATNDFCFINSGDKSFVFSTDGGVSSHLVLLGRTITAGSPASGDGNSLTLAGSAAVSGNTNGGDVVLTPGAKSGSGADGNVRTTVGRFVPNPSANSTVPAISNSAGTAGLWFSVAGPFGLISNNLLWCSLGSELIGLRSASSLSWASTSDPTAAKDTGLARSSAAVAAVTNGTAGQWGSLLCGTRDSGTTTVTNGLTVGHQSTGTPAAGLGSAVLYRINSSTTADQDAGRVTAYWTDATHATRTAAVGIEVVSNAGSLAEVLRVTGSGTVGTGLSVTGNAAGSGVTLQVLSSGTNEQLQIYAKGADPIYLGNSGVANWGLSATKLTANSTASIGWSSSTVNAAGVVQDAALTRSAAAVAAVTNGTAGQWGSLLCGTRDSGTTTVTNGLTVGHQSTGTPAAGLGSAVLYRINSSTTADQDAVQVAALWTVATHASRTSEYSVRTVTNAGALAEVARFDGGGGATPSAGNTGFMLWDVDNGTLERVTVGAADSGGLGYKCLRIPN